MENNFDVNLYKKAQEGLTTINCLHKIINEEYPYVIREEFSNLEYTFNIIEGRYQRILDKIEDYYPDINLKSDTEREVSEKTLFTPETLDFLYRCSRECNEGMETLIEILKPNLRKKDKTDDSKISNIINCVIENTNSLSETLLSTNLAFYYQPGLIKKDIDKQYLLLEMKKFEKRNIQKSKDVMLDRIIRRLETLLEELKDLQKM